jgi:hypothetical protein
MATGPGQKPWPRHHLTKQINPTQSELRVTKLDDLCNAFHRSIGVNEALKRENANLIRKNEQITQVLNTLVSAIEKSRVMALFSNLCERFELLNLSLKDTRVSEMQSDTEVKPRPAVISNSERELTEDPNEDLAYDTSKTMEISALELPTILRQGPGD